MSVQEVLVVLSITTIWVLICYSIYKKFFQKKYVKENCEEGFGIVYNGELLLDSNRPLIFENLKEAQDHARNRGFDKGNTLNPYKKTDLKYVYQRWFVGDGRLVLHPLILQEEK